MSDEEIWITVYAAYISKHGHTHMHANENARTFADEALVQYHDRFKAPPAPAPVERTVYKPGR